MRIRRRLIRFLCWGMVLFASILAGGVWFAYTYLTDSDTAKLLIQAQAKHFFPGSVLDMSRVKLNLFSGSITLSKVALRQTIDGAPFSTVGIPWLQVKLDPKKLMHGEVQPLHVIVSQPTLQICRRKDGTWNLQGLLADPWPAPALKDPPPVEIKHGTVELVIENEQATALPLENGNKSERGIEREGDTPYSLERQTVAILRDVDLTIKSVGPSSTALEFEGTAKGDTFEKITLQGVIDPDTGRLILDGDLSRLTVSKALLERVPTELRPALAQLGLKGGEINLSIKHISFDPQAAESQRLRYEATAHLRAGVWECKTLPFPISDLSADLAVQDGVLEIENVEGHNGKTKLQAFGSIKLGDPERSPFDFEVRLLDLDLDQRLRDRTPPEYDELWDVFKPKGKVNTAVHAVRNVEGGPVGIGARVECRGVSGVYRHFPYPVEDMEGTLTLVGKVIEVDLKTKVGGKPVSLVGRIDDPGPDAIVRLKIDAESVPVDQKLFDAVPPDVRKVVNDFKPSGTAKASAVVVRTPLIGPDDPRKPRPEGNVFFDAVIDLGQSCSIQWAGLPYPVRNLKGKLIIHPDLWEFSNMRGENGQAIITAKGRVQKLPLPRRPNGEEPLKVEVEVHANNLLFNDELRDSLQPAWQKTWTTINPTGSTDVAARVDVEPGKPDSVHVVIRPRAKSNVRLVIPTIDPNFTPEIPMENVSGLFTFHNDIVSMSEAKFEFRGAPVTFDSGTVFVRNNGKFELSVKKLHVKQTRLDSGFRKIMPSMMASFARRLDDGKTFTALGDLKIGWSGIPGDPAWCSWENTKVFFTDNAVQTGIPVEHIQGQLEQVAGRSDGRDLQVSGKVRLGSINILGQQLTDLNAGFLVDTKIARMDDIEGKLLGGRLSGACWIGLNSPTAASYGANLRLRGAGLEQYGLTVPGRQSYRGQLDAELGIQGLGADVRSLSGEGWAKVTQGDLGELPFVFQLAKVLNENLLLTGRSRGSLKTAFDEAEVKFRIHDGVTNIEPIKLTGNAMRLAGEGTLDPQGNLEIALRILYGRGNVHVPVFSELLNEASREIIGVRVHGTAKNPQFDVKPLPLLRPVSRERQGSLTGRKERAATVRR